MPSPFTAEDYLELMSVSDRAEHLAARGRRRRRGAVLVDFLARGGGFRYVVVQSDDLAADVVAMRQRGVDVRTPSEGGRRTPAGRELRWKVGGARRAESAAGASSSST